MIETDLLPFFSIVIPTYQRRELARNAVESVSRLTYPGRVEVIVIIDGSTDGTELALLQVKCPFPKRIIWQANTGLAEARNRGAEQAEGDILLFLDDDMTVAPDLLNEHASTLLQGADAVIGHIPLDPRSPPGFLAAGVGKWADQQAERLSCGAAPTLFDYMCGQMSVRRCVFKKIGGFDGKFTAGGGYGDEDIDFILRLKERHVVCFNPLAKSFQLYDVDPKTHLEQWAKAGRADVFFARKHPPLALEMFDLHGANKRVVRWLIRPSAGLPIVNAIARWLACAGARNEHRLPAPLRLGVEKLFYAARDLGYWRAVRQAGGIPTSKEVLVLCYHAIRDVPGDKILEQYGISVERLAEQLDALFRRGFTFVSPDEALSLIVNGTQVPRKAVLITFDDCYEELASVVRKILEPRKIMALAFAVSGMKSQSNEWDQRAGAQTLKLLDDGGLSDIARRGVEIGCHSRTHRAFPTLTQIELDDETRGSIHELTASGLPPPRAFAYPFGEHDQKSRNAAKQAGFLVGFTVAPRRARWGADCFAVPRVEVFARDKRLRFWLKTAAPSLSRALEWRLALRSCKSKLAHYLTAQIARHTKQSSA